MVRSLKINKLCLLSFTKRGKTRNTKTKSNLVSKQKRRIFIFSSKQIPTVGTTIKHKEHPKIAGESKHLEAKDQENWVLSPKKYRPIVPEKFSATMRSKRRFYL